MAEMYQLDCTWHYTGKFTQNIKVPSNILSSVVDLGEGPRRPAPLPPPFPLFWLKKEEMTEGEKASRASKSRHPPPPP